MARNDIMSFQELIEKEREQRRTYILDAAEGLFFERGFTSVTMEELARTVGLNKATIYLYFEDKDSLFFAIVLRRIRIINDQYEAISRMDLTGREKCRRMGETYFTFARENPAYFRMLCTAGPSLFTSRENTLAQSVHEHLKNQARFMYDALSEGIADGTVRNDLDPLEMTAFISVTTQSVVCLNPYWRTALEEKGITYEHFVGNYLAFMGNALDKRDPGNKGQNAGSRARKKRTAH